MKDNTEWFAKCGWGVLCCYLGAPPSSAGGAELSADEWNRQVDAFDAQGLADQLAALGVPYFFITIGQNSGHFLAPNATYDRHVAIQPSKYCRSRPSETRGKPCVSLGQLIRPHSSARINIRVGSVSRYGLSRYGPDGR